MEHDDLNQGWMRPAPQLPTMTEDRRAYNMNMHKLEKLKYELRMQKRKKELNQWAENDYKINVHNISNEMLSTRQSLSKKASPKQVPNFYVHQSNLIGDETDFIFKVRNKWIH